MQSGAGRRLTLRSEAAWLARWVTERGSRRVAAAFTAAMTPRVPTPVKVPVSAANSSSTAVRSSTAQASCFLHEIHGTLFIQLPGVQRAQGVRHLDDQGFRHAEQPAAAVRGLAPGQRDLLGRAQVTVFAAVLAQVLRSQGRARSVDSWRSRASKVTDNLACCPASPCP